LSLLMSDSRPLVVLIVLCIAPSLS